MFNIPPDPKQDQRVSDKPLGTPKPMAHDPDGGDVDADSPQGEDLYYYVNECFDNGSSKNEVLKQLRAYGYSQDDAEMIVDDAARWRYKNSHSRPAADISTHSDGYGYARSGSANMWIGGGICLLGIVITVGSCMAAGEGGGRYFLAIGAIVGGAIQFFRGLSQSD